MICAKYDPKFKSSEGSRARNNRMVSTPRVLYRSNRQIMKIYSRKYMKGNTIFGQKLFEVQAFYYANGRDSLY